MRNCPWRRMNYKFMNMWKGNGNSVRLLFSLRGLVILHQERRGQVKTIVMEHFSGNLVHKSGSAELSDFREAVHRSLAIYLTVNWNLGKHQLGDPLMTAVRQVITSNGVPYFQNMLGSHSTSGRERRKKRWPLEKGWGSIIIRILNNFNTEVRLEYRACVFS